LVANDSGLLVDQLAAMEDNEIGDAADVVAGSELRILFGVDFEDEGTTGCAGGGLSYLGLSDSARTAPVGPEIDEHRNGRLGEDLIEESRIGV
jgi:hypothetical protein